MTRNQYFLFAPLLILTSLILSLVLWAAVEIIKLILNI